MRSPSSRILSNRCDVYVAGPGRGPGGGVQFPISTTPTYASEPCSIQPRATEVIDDQRRITQLTVYHVIFGRVLSVGPRDTITYTDASGKLRTIVVLSIEDQAGRGAAFRVLCQERL